MAIVAVGSVALDSITTPAGTSNDVLGGSLTYFSFAASLFVPVHLVAVIGDDFPSKYLAWFDGRAMQLDGLERKAGGKSFRWSGRYSDDFATRTTTALHLNVFQEFHPKLPPAARRQPYLFLGNIDPDLQLDVFAQMEHPAFVVSDTMDHWIAHKRDRLLELLPRVHTFLLNDEEARLLSEAQDVERAARWIVARGADCVIVKCGADGSLLATSDGVARMPAFRIPNLADPTGAGDSFAGGLLGYIASRRDHRPDTMREAILHGAAVASFCVEELGVKGLLPITRRDVETRVQQLQALNDLPSSIRMPAP